MTLTRLFSAIPEFLEEFSAKNKQSRASAKAQDSTTANNDVVATASATASATAAAILQQHNAAAATASAKAPESGNSNRASAKARDNNNNNNNDNSDASAKAHNDTENVRSRRWWGRNKRDNNNDDTGKNNGNASRSPSNNNNNKTNAGSRSSSNNHKNGDGPRPTSSGKGSSSNRNNNATNSDNNISPTFPNLPSTSSSSSNNNNNNNSAASNKRAWNNQPASFMNSARTSGSGGSSSSGSGGSSSSAPSSNGGIAALPDNKFYEFGVCIDFCKTGSCPNGNSCKRRHLSAPHFLSYLDTPQGQKRLCLQHFSNNRICMNQPCGWAHTAPKPSSKPLLQQSSSPSASPHWLAANNICPSFADGGCRRRNCNKQHAFVCRQCKDRHFDSFESLCQHSESKHSTSGGSGRSSSKGSGGNNNTNKDNNAAPSTTQSSPNNSKTNKLVTNGSALIYDLAVVEVTSATINIKPKPNAQLGDVTRTDEGGVDITVVKAETTSSSEAPTKSNNNNNNNNNASKKKETSKAEAVQPNKNSSSSSPPPEEQQQPQTTRQEEQQHTRQEEQQQQRQAPSRSRYQSSPVSDGDLTLFYNDEVVRRDGFLRVRYEASHKIIAADFDKNVRRTKVTYGSSSSPSSTILRSRVTFEDLDGMAMEQVAAAPVKDNEMRIDFTYKRRDDPEVVEMTESFAKRFSENSEKKAAAVAEKAKQQQQTNNSNKAAVQNNTKNSAALSSPKKQQQHSPATKIAVSPLSRMSQRTGWADESDWYADMGLHGAGLKVFKKGMIADNYKGRFCGGRAAAVILGTAAVHRAPARDMNSLSMGPLSQCLTLSPKPWSALYPYLKVGSIMRGPLYSEEQEGEQQDDEELKKRRKEQQQAEKKRQEKDAGADRFAPEQAISLFRSDFISDTDSVALDPFRYKEIWKCVVCAHQKAVDVKTDMVCNISSGASVVEDLITHTRKAACSPVCERCKSQDSGGLGGVGVMMLESIRSGPARPMIITPLTVSGDDDQLHTVTEREHKRHKKMVHSNGDDDSNNNESEKRIFSPVARASKFVDDFTFGRHVYRPVAMSVFLGAANQKSDHHVPVVRYVSSDHWYSYDGAEGKTAKLGQQLVSLVLALPIGRVENSLDTDDEEENELLFGGTKQQETQQEDDKDNEQQQQQQEQEQQDEEQADEEEEEVTQDGAPQSNNNGDDDDDDPSSGDNGGNTGADEGAATPRWPPSNNNSDDDDDDYSGSGGATPPLKTGSSDTVLMMQQTQHRLAVALEHSEKKVAVLQQVLNSNLEQQQRHLQQNLNTSSIQQKLQQSQLHAKSLEQNLEKQASDLAQLQEEVKQKQQTVDALQQQQQKQRQVDDEDKSSSKQELKQLRQQSNNKQQQLDDIQQQLAALRKEHETLQQQHEQRLSEMKQQQEGALTDAAERLRTNHALQLQELRDAQHVPLTQAQQEMRTKHDEQLQAAQREIETWRVRHAAAAKSLVEAQEQQQQAKQQLLQQKTVGDKEAHLKHVHENEILRMEQQQQRSLADLRQQLEDEHQRQMLDAHERHLQEIKTAGHQQHKSLLEQTQQLQQQFDEEIAEVRAANAIINDDRKAEQQLRINEERRLAFELQREKEQHITAQRELDNLKPVCQDLHSRVQSVAAEKQRLEEQSKNQLKQLQEQQQQQHTLQHDLDSLRSRHDLAAAEVRQLKQQTEGQVVEMCKQRESSKLFASSQEARIRHLEERLKSEKPIAAQQLAAQQQQSSRLVEQLKQQVAEAEAEVATSKATASSQRSDNAELQRTVVEREAELQRNKQLLVEMQCRLDSESKKQQHQQHEHSELQQQLQVAVSTIETKTRMITELEYNAASLQRRLNEVGSQLEQEKRSSSSVSGAAQARVRTLEEQLRTSTWQAEKQKQQADELGQQLNSKKQALQQMEAFNKQQQQQLEQKISELAGDAADKTQLDAILQNQKQQKSLIETENRNLSQQLLSAQHDLSAANGNFDRKSRQLTAQVEQLQAQNEYLAESTSKMAAENNRLQHQLGDLNGKMDRLREAEDRMRSKIFALQVTGENKQLSAQQEQQQLKQQVDQLDRQLQKEREQSHTRAPLQVMPANDARRRLAVKTLNASVAAATPQSAVEINSAAAAAEDAHDTPNVVAARCLFSETSPATPEQQSTTMMNALIELSRTNNSNTAAETVSRTVAGKLVPNALITMNSIVKQIKGQSHPSADQNSRRSRVESASPQRVSKPTPAGISSSIKEGIRSAIGNNCGILAHAWMLFAKHVISSAPQLPQDDGFDLSMDLASVVDVASKLEENDVTGLTKTNVIGMLPRLDVVEIVPVTASA